VLETPADSYNPIVLHGPSGTGKSHLADGVFRQWQTRRRRRGAISVTARDFVCELREAVETKTTDQFRTPYRRAPLLVFEDLDELDGKQAAQQELLSILDELMKRGSWVLVTARTNPRTMPRLHCRLQARLLGGLVIPLAEPDRQARIALLRHFAQLRKQKLPEVVIEALADGLAVTAPRLWGAVRQLETLAHLSGRSIDLELVGEYITDRGSSPPAAVAEIARLTARQFGVPVGELRGPSRRRAVTTARSVAMYLARKHTQNSLDRIGAYFGGRDRTTVAHGCSKTLDRMRSESAVRQAVSELEKQLETMGTR